MTKSKQLRVLESHYNNVIVPDLLQKGLYKNIHDIPKIEKIVLNLSANSAVLDSKQILPPLLALELITGRKAKSTQAHKSVANFKLRKGSVIGGKVTLRNKDMYIFLNKLIHIVLPRVKDFKGFTNKSFDGRGNFNFGIKDILVFPELEKEYDKFDRIYGVDISVVTTAKGNDDAFNLLSAFQLPFRN